MKTNLWKDTIAAGCIVAAGFGVGASPLQRADVAGDPAWVVHADCDGLRPTTIGKYLLGEMQKPEAQAKFAAFQALFSFDLRTQLHGLTLYSTGIAPEDGVLLVYADFDPARLTTLAKAAKDYESSEHNQHVIHSWIDENKKDKHGDNPRVYAAIQGQRVIFGQRSATVATALDVLDGKTPALAASGNFPQLGAAGGNNFIEGSARKLDLTDPNAAILRLAKRIRLEIGEATQQVAATLTLETNEEEVAKQIVAIAQGLVALTKLQKEKPDAQKVADAITIKQDGTTAVGTFAMPAADVVDLMKAGAARKAQKN